MSRAADLGYAAGWRAVRTLPGPVAAALFRAGADRAARKRGPGATRLAANLRQVIGGEVPDHVVRAALRSYARYWLEAFRLPNQSSQQRRDGFHLERGLLLGDDVATGRGAIVALPHAGNWDAAGAWVAAMGWPISPVAERLKPESLFRRFVAFRESLGMQIVPLTGGPAPIDVLVDRLKQGHIVPLLADRDLSARGVPVDFFGAKTRMPAGPALLAIRTGAPLYVADMWYEPERPVGHLHGPLELAGPAGAPMDVRVRAVTQQLADLFAAGIAKHPEDWHMLQRMWVA